MRPISTEHIETRRICITKTCGRSTLPLDSPTCRLLEKITCQAEGKKRKIKMHDFVLHVFCFDRSRRSSTNG